MLYCCCFLDDNDTVDALEEIEADSLLNAIDLANACGVTLVGFVRGDSFNIYTYPERIR